MIEKNKKAEAFDNLYYSYYVPVFRYVLGQIKNKEEAEDITQGVFLKVFEHKPPQEYQDIKPAYFFTIARNRIIDFYKKKKSLLLDFSEDHFNLIKDERANAQQEIEKDEIKNEILSALDHLNFDQKEVLTLKFFADLTNEEISNITGKSQDVIRQTLSRSLRKLQTVLN